MKRIEVDPAYVVAAERDPIKELCWTARELLGAYMEEGCEFEGDEAEVNELSFYEDENGLTIHETSSVPINSKQSACLSNIPFIDGPNGDTMPWTEPGYVALRTESVIPQGGSKDGEGECGQIIFRVPSPQDTAAIFEGYSIDDEAQLKLSDKTKLKRITRLLNCMRANLRQAMENDPDTYDASYHANVPRTSAGKMIDLALQELGDN